MVWSIKKVIEMDLCMTCVYYDKKKSICNYFEDKIDFEVFECSDFKKKTM